MKIHTIWAQRKERYPGQFLPELLGAIDENGNSDNPDYIIDDLKKLEDMVEQGLEFESVKHIILDLPQLTWEKVQEILAPEQIITVKSDVRTKEL